MTMQLDLLKEQFNDDFVEMLDNAKPDLAEVIMETILHKVDFIDELESDVKVIVSEQVDSLVEEIIYQLSADWVFNRLNTESDY